MTQKRVKAEIPADMWLHVATDALARYVGGGGTLITSADVTDMDDKPAIMIFLPVGLDDPRLSPSFVALLSQVKEPTP